jgi:hypothetical protein
LPHRSKRPPILGVLPLIVHRLLLQILNLKKVPLAETPPDKLPLDHPKGCPDTGYGTDVNNAYTGATGFPLGRNCSAIPHEKRFSSTEYFL